MFYLILMQSNIIYYIKNNPVMRIKQYTYTRMIHSYTVNENHIYSNMTLNKKEIIYERPSIGKIQ